MLLVGLALKGALVTLDAMGCQKEIAERILECEADYLWLRCPSSLREDDPLHRRDPLPG